MNSGTVQRTDTQASNIAKGFNITEGLTVQGLSCAMQYKSLL